MLNQNLELRKMSKKSRLALVIVVLAICFAFLWPSISWYVRTPKDEKALALTSLENIKDYSNERAAIEAKELVSAAKKNPELLLTKNQEWLRKAAVKNLKNKKKAVPSKMTLHDAVSSFGSAENLTSAVESKYRNAILKNKKNYQNSVKLGLDLSGGMNVIVKADLDAVMADKGDVADAAALRAEAMADAIEKLTNSIDRFGLSSPTIRQQGEDHIYIELPGAAEADQINSIIQGRGMLSFRLVDDDQTNAFYKYYYEHMDSTFDSKGNLIDPSIVSDDVEILGYYMTDDYGLDQMIGYRAVKKQVALEGKYIKSADVSLQALTNKPQCTFILDPEGAQIFADFTASNVGKPLCVVSDGKIKSVAGIEEAIATGQVAITGFSTKEASNLKKVLQSAALEVPLTVESQQIIGASLGEKAIRQGLWALAVGLIAIMIFMLIWYKGAGVNACVAQILNMYIMFSILSALNLTVTLPMIAGMILTVGMAVDANVIIFERIKEELVLGKDRAASISSGFDNALYAILDSNITTFIAAAFMSQLGSGSIQGFSYSLAIGVVSTLFTSLFVSRLIFDFNTQQIKKKNISISWGIK